MAKSSAREGGGCADQENRTYRQRVVERAADGTGENIPQRHHSEGERLALGRILGINVQNDILDHRRGDHGEGDELKNIGRIQAAHTGCQRNGQRLEHKHRGRKTDCGGTTEAAEQPVIQEHHGDLHDGGEAADQTHVRGVPVDIAHHVDQIVVYQIVGEEEQCNPGEHAEETSVLPIKLREAAGGRLVPAAEIHISFSVPGTEAEQKQCRSLQCDADEKYRRQNLRTDFFQKMTDQNGYRRESDRTGPSGRAVVDMTDAKPQVDTDLRVHGVQGNFDTDEQHVEQRDCQASAGELAQQQDQNNLQQEKQPLASIYRDLLRAVNQRGQKLRDQKPQNVAGGEDLAELGVAVPAGLKMTQ